MTRGMPRTVPKSKSTPSTTRPSARSSVLSGLDRALGYDSRSGAAARGADSGGDGVYPAAPALDDVPDDELCGVAPGKVLPVSEKWHPLLIKALSSIPALNAGDSVWWHCDVIHSVAPVENQQGWGNVMYIPSAPMCEKTSPTRRRSSWRWKTALRRGLPREDYEADWQERFTTDDLNIHGKRALGIAV